jgi:3-(3-hydroxy-phenyl)propionate hydroxylase
VVAIDVEKDIYPLPRALGMDDEIQRVFQTVGLIDELRTNSTPLLGAEFLDAQRKRVVGLELEAGTLGAMSHPPVVTFDQPSVEADLRAAAAAAGVDFRLGLEATSVEVEADGVVIGTRSDASAGRLRGRWLIGADGASSTVRKLTGRDLVDLGFDQTWLVVDATQLDPELSLPRIAQQHCDARRIVTFIPAHGTRRRWEFKLHPDEDREAMLEPESVAALLSPWGSGDQLQVDRAAVYRFHATVADSFGTGSVFLVGDAAHQMPPFNGQGMCTGIRDAENLAWKLAMVHDGRAGGALLSTYDLERRPHATGQVHHSADAGRLIDMIAAGDFDSVESGYGGGREFPHIDRGIVDGDHSAVGNPIPQPMVDGVFLDDLIGDGFALISVRPIPDDSAAPWQQIGARMVTLDPSTLPGLLDEHTVVVVRPDRYVAAVTTDLDSTTGRLLDLLHSTNQGR